MQRTGCFTCQEEKYTNMRTGILFLAMVLTLASCKKNKTNEIQDVLRCTMPESLDSSATVAKLIGSWTWKKQSIANTNQFKDADKSVTVTFISDSTFSVAENSSVVLQGTWKVINYGSFYGLQTDPYSQYIGGAIYFCDNQLLFVASIYDGADNLFEK